MKLKADEKKEDTCGFVLPEYGKRKLIAYAESFEELSEGYSSLLNAELIASKQELVECQERKENNRVIARQLKEVSKILHTLAGEAYYTSYSMEKHKKQILKILKENGLFVKDLYVVENQNGYMEIGITMRAMYHDTYSADQIAAFLSKLCHTKMEVDRESVPYIGEEIVTVIYKEKVNFTILSGVAKAAKEGEVFSGDNYSLKEYSFGSYLAAISDGMGSGVEACHDSQQVIELLEKLLESGFDLETSGEMLNDLLCLQSNSTRTATLDACEINLYSGQTWFVKAGAAASYLKRGKYVKRIEQTSLPLGLFGGGSQEAFSRDLREGDYVILVSDGVSDCFVEEEYDDYLELLLGRAQYENPQELANGILSLAIKRGGGRLLDDMTVLVLGIIEKQ